MEPFAEGGADRMIGPLEVALEDEGLLPRVERPDGKRARQGR